MRATTEPVALDAYREEHREKVHKHLRLVEERAMEGTSIAYERITADRPELARLKSCHLGAVQALQQFGEGLGRLITSDVVVPTELYVAQSEIAGVARCLRELLMEDVAENRDHRAIVTVLRGDHDDQDGGA